MAKDNEGEKVVDSSGSSDIVSDCKKIDDKGNDTER